MLYCLFIGENKANCLSNINKSQGVIYMKEHAEKVASSWLCQTQKTDNAAFNDKVSSGCEMCGGTRSFSCKFMGFVIYENTF